MSETNVGAAPVENLRRSADQTSSPADQNPPPPRPPKPPKSSNTPPPPQQSTDSTAITSNSSQQTLQPPPQNQQQPPPPQQQQQPPPPQQQPIPYVSNACCGDCTLSEGVGWIAAIECIWAIVTLFIVAVYVGYYHSAQNKISTGRSFDNNDKNWKAFGDEHMIALYGALLFHVLEAVASIFLMAASSRRIRSLCFAWIVSISVISIGEIVVVALDRIHLTFVMVGIIPLRFYFAFIVWSLAQEIVVFPQGPPARLIYTEMPNTTYEYVGGPTTTVYTSPMMYTPAYGYGYGYAPYYGGYGYGGYGYGNDAALTGFALGAGLGYGHHHHGYGYGCSDFGYGGCDYGGGFYDC